MWDEEKKKWVDKNADPDDEANGANVAPPSDMELSRNNSSADVAAMGQQQPSAPPGSDINCSKIICYRMYSKKWIEFKNLYVSRCNRNG